MTKPSPNLVDRIKESLERQNSAEARRSKTSEERTRFVQGIVEYFSTPEIIQAIIAKKMELPLFSSYRSSMGAAISGSHPDYELCISPDGLCVKRGGKIAETHPFPPDYKEWYECFPWGVVFHDSSWGEDYHYCPDLVRTIQSLEGMIMTRI